MVPCSGGRRRAPALRCPWVSAARRAARSSFPFRHPEPLGEGEGRIAQEEWRAQHGGQQPYTSWLPGRPNPNLRSVPLQATHSRHHGVLRRGAKWVRGGRWRGPAVLARASEPPAPLRPLSCRLRLATWPRVSAGKRGSGPGSRERPASGRWAGIPPSAISAPMAHAGRCSNAARGSSPCGSSSCSAAGRPSPPTLAAPALGRLSAGTGCPMGRRWPPLARSALWTPPVPPPAAAARLLGDSPRCRPLPCRVCPLNRQAPRSSRPSARSATLWRRARATSRAPTWAACSAARPARRRASGALRGAAL